MSSIVAGPPEAEIDYPEGPASLPESDSHTTRRAELLFALRHWYASRSDTQDAWVSSDINVYYREGDPKVVVAPDLAVAFGVDVAAVKGKSVYKVWEAGAAPCFALEIASPRTLRTDLHVKPAKYASLGADEYWRLDPSGGELLNPPLQGERRQAGSWVPIEVVPEDDGLRGRSEALGLDLCWQPPKLRLWDIAAGVWLPDPDDLSEQAALAAAQAARADEKAAALRAAEAELAELRARLDGNP